MGLRENDYTFASLSDSQLWGGTLGSPLAYMARMSGIGLRQHWQSTWFCCWTHTRGNGSGNTFESGPSDWKNILGDQEGEISQMSHVLTITLNAVNREYSKKVKLKNMYKHFTTWWYLVNILCFWKLKSHNKPSWLLKTISSTLQIQTFKSISSTSDSFSKVP